MGVMNKHSAGFVTHLAGISNKEDIGLFEHISKCTMNIVAGEQKVAEIPG